MKDITIVVPVYNSEKYISRCLDSILRQNMDNYDLLLINDGSTDRSKEIIEDYEKKYDNIKVINQSNHGVSYTRNYAIKNVKTKYIMFIDNDDYIDKDYVKTLYNTIESSDYDMVFSGYRRTNVKGEVTVEIKLIDSEWSKFVVFTPWAKIFKTDFLRDNNIYFLENNIGEDTYLCLLSVLTSNNMKVIDYVGYNWFINDESVSNTSQTNINKVNVYKLLNSCYDEIIKRNLLDKNYEIIQAHFTRYSYWFIIYATFNSSFFTIRREYKKLFKWLSERFPNYKKSNFFTMKKPEAEEPKARKGYYRMHLMNRKHLGVLYIYAYNKYRKLVALKKKIIG